MRINWNEVDLILAQKTMKKSTLAQRMGVLPERITVMRRRAETGFEFGPFIVGRLAKALRVPVERIAILDGKESGVR